MLADRVEALDAWDDVRFLSVSVDRLRRWYRPGLLCIGDAAHATSPARGVGINLAVQDAVATANMAGGSLALNSRVLSTPSSAPIQQPRQSRRPTASGSTSDQRARKRAATASTVLSA
jgi:2-polyprenyl-6-methoxyphenol hydroxylase-like FAD-dependent oxidoreductase